MNEQPEAWVGAIGGLVVLFAVVVAIASGLSAGASTPRRNFDLFKLGEVYEEPYYRPSPTNFMREVDKVGKKRR
jgi:hypothetical protein